MRVLSHSLLIILLTLLSLVGGVAWAIVLLFRLPAIAFLPLYAVLSISLIFIAPSFGRHPVSCLTDGPLQVASPLYCALNRTYVTAPMQDVLTELADEIDARFPGTVTYMLDGNLPLFDGFPLLPHLSHSDGRKADLAFYYRDAGGSYTHKLRSPIGYFAFEQGPTDCQPRWASLRWDLNWLQPLWRDLSPDAPRMRAAIEILSADTRIGKIFVEPHLRADFGANHPKVRFQGCRAARHDDHLHIQL